MGSSSLLAAAAHAWHTALSANQWAGLLAQGTPTQLGLKLYNRKVPMALAYASPLPLSSKILKHLSVWTGVFTLLARKQAASLGRWEAEFTAGRPRSGRFTKRQETDSESELKNPSTDLISWSNRNMQRSFCCSDGSPGRVSMTSTL